MGRMGDYIVRASAADCKVLAFAATTKEMVEEARKAHNSSPVVTAALGRLLTAGAMMGVSLKGEKELLTLRVNGSGPIGGMIVTGDSKGNVKGYAFHPQAIVPVNNKGKLDVAGVVGRGNILVIKDLGLKEPYVGQTELVTGEIAEDLTYYFAASEQIPSSVGLGVLMEKNNTVRQAGGFLIQLMPFTEERIIEKIEYTLSKIPSVTEMLDDGNNPEQMLSLLLGDLGLCLTDRRPLHWHCNCSAEKIEKVIASIGKKEIEEMIEEGQPVEVTCHFCNKNYSIEVEKLKDMVKK